MPSRFRRALSTVAHALTRILSKPTPSPTSPARGVPSKPAGKPPAEPSSPTPPGPHHRTTSSSRSPGAAVPSLGGRARRSILVLTTQGLEFPSDLTEREASAAGRHWNAVRRYLDYGYDWDLAEFEGVEVGGFELETRTNAIEWHAVRGEVRFESIYDEVI